MALIGVGLSVDKTQCPCYYCRNVYRFTRA